MIICLTDSIEKENSFYTVYEYLNQHFEVSIMAIGDNPMDILKTNPSAIVTNSIRGMVVSKMVRTIYYISDEDGGVFKDANTNIRRQLQVRPEMDIFSASGFMARLLYANYQTKSKIQYPYIRDNAMSEQSIIVYNEPNVIIDVLQQEMPQEQFCQYESLQDLAEAKLYIHIPSFHEATNIRIPTAASYGVPTVAVGLGCIPEIITQGDLLLSQSANIKQWIQGVKTTMRDHSDNSKFAKDGSKKFSNLDALVEKVKQLSAQRAIRKQEFTPPPPIKDHIRTARSRIARVNNKPSISAHFIPDVFVDKGIYVNPVETLVDTPAWFTKDKISDVDVSIIVPLYRSGSEIAAQINSWDMEDDGLKKEIIYVSDACPQKSEEVVMSTWSARNPNNVGKIVMLSSNSGFSTACNAGAREARGDYLIFLNADTTVTKNWINPMYNMLHNDSTVGIVGNMQLKIGSDLIDSAGSEWMWDSRNFEHIGRNVYNGKRLSATIRLSEAPEDLLVPGERDMVTGCCMMMPKKLFDQVGGFDVGYRIGYWEDSDINMIVKSLGFKVMYQPQSVIYHKGCHSRAGLHPFIMDNARKFYERWVDNNKIDNLVKTKRP
jgi:GT2 family glycosyltransferase